MPPSSTEKSKNSDIPEASWLSNVTCGAIGLGADMRLRWGPSLPQSREVTSWIMTHPEHLRNENADNLHRLRERDPELDRLTLHVRKFAVMMTERHGDRIEDWITAAEQDTLAPLASFARNLRRDLDAVRNGLSLPYSSGAVEGNVNRLKMLKRQMFGRAGLDLLRKRVLLAR